MKKHLIEGKVVHVQVGPGCWGIVDDKGRQWRPVNMPEQLKHKDRRVKVEAQEIEESFDIFMWGTPVKVLSFGTLMP